jgi:DNA polymerase I-like protein with 3'-5' exonuclease and polymerase domains
MPELRPLILSELKPPMNITLVQDDAGLDKLAHWIALVGMAAIPICGLDTETNFVHDFWFRRVRTIQIGDKDAQFVIDLLAFAGGDPLKLVESQGNYGVNNGGLYDKIFEVLDPVLCTAKFLKVGQNLPFEYEVFNWNFGRRIWHLYSTDLAERVIQAGRIALKKYKEFSMLQIVERYFHLTINKDEQKNFDLESPLTQEQIEYAAFDVRMPLAMRLAQLRVLTADQLLATVQIENDAIGTFVDAHLVGQNIDDARWMKRVEAVKARRIEELKILDETFIPKVGTKTTAIDYNELDRLEGIWRNNFEKPTADEEASAVAIREEKDKLKKEPLRTILKNQKQLRAQAKAGARSEFSALSKIRTKYLKIIDKCEGEAFLNYASNQQLLAALQQFPGMKNIDSAADDVLIKFNDRPMIQVLRRYRKGKKETGTYGVVWTQRWITKPLAAEGWRHPGDGRLHCRFNQLEAETGRTSSEKPNAQNLPKDDEIRACFICDPPDPITGEENCIVTVDMAGAELRIIAELAQAQSWITAFAKGQDVHSVSTEILYPERWPTLACKGGELWYDPEKKKEVVLPPCEYYALDAEGQPKRLKCKCPQHVELRNGAKFINFLLCYGGGPDALADDLGVSLDTAKELMKLHEQRFPEVWAYLFRSGEAAKRNGEARDMYGRRRLFLEPTYDLAREWVMDNDAEKLELEDEDCDAALFAFKAKELREPTEDEKWSLTHRAPTDKEIRSGMRAMLGSIGRRGKNHCIQGTNASIIKRAMGCGFDKNGVPYLWHTLPKYKARIQNMVHDELVVHCPKKYGEQVKALVGDAFKRAAAEVMHLVIMEFDGHIAERWMK